MKPGSECFLWLGTLLRGVDMAEPYSPDGTTPRESR